MNPQPLIECVPNVSEGRDLPRLNSLVATIERTRGVLLLHRTSDWDHHRSVFTFAGPANAVREAALRLCEKAFEAIDLTAHRGVHPRLGAVDVLPFVPLADTPLSACVELAHATGERIWSEFGVPVYFYGAAAKRSERAKLENVRRGQFELLRDSPDPEKAPDIGGPRLHPKAGAVIVGARKFLIAYNINLNTADLSTAKYIARKVRESSGGFPGVKALGLSLESLGIVQVSMNITDFEATSLHQVFLQVQRLAGEQGVAIRNSELIGLMPRRALELAAAGFLQLEGFESQHVVETRLETLLAQRDSVS